MYFLDLISRPTCYLRCSLRSRHALGLIVIDVVCISGPQHACLIECGWYPFTDVAPVWVAVYQFNIALHLKFLLRFVDFIFIKNIDI